MTVLADTSVWVNHFRGHEGGLAGLLNRGSVLMHPVVLGELACGNLANRAVIIGSLQALPRAAVATHAEVLHLVEEPSFGGWALAGRMRTFSPRLCSPAACFGRWIEGSSKPPPA